LEPFNFYLKYFFLSHSFEDIHSERKKPIFFKGDFHPLICDSARIKKNVSLIFVHILKFNISKAHLNRRRLCFFVIICRFFNHVADTLTGKSNVLSTTYFPAIDLSDDDYELGLMNFETYNTIPNMNASNNKFYFNDVEITIPEVSYKLRAINEFLKQAISSKHLQHTVHDDDKKRGIADDDDDEDEDFLIVLRANNTIKR